MIKAVAVDDEVNALGIIQEFCSRIPEVELVKTFTDPVEALKMLKDAKDIDMVFLDIQMANMNGLTLASALPAETRVVLTTAYAEYALQGFNLDVVDYLLKPFSFERFERAIRKVNNSRRQDGFTPGQQPVLLTPNSDDIIFVKTDYKTVKVRLSDLKFIEGSGNYVTLHTSKGKILALQNMKNFEEQLLPYQFIRIHKSYIVSLQYIDAIEKNEIKVGDKSLTVGESYKENLQSFIRTNFKQF